MHYLNAQISVPKLTVSSYENELKNFKTIFLETLYKANECKRRRYQLNSKQQISYYKLDKYGSFQNKGIKAY